MEKRIGAALILVEDKNQVNAINTILSRHSHLIIGRQGIPLRDKDLNIISLILEGSTDETGALSGQLGRLEGVQVKTLLTKK